jgi:transcriptional regulator GlxA family with amidase domain
MQRRELICKALALAAAGAAPMVAQARTAETGPGCITMAKPRERERVKVAFLLSEGTTVMNIVGPWEVFQDVTLNGRGARNPFELYTVAESPEPLRLSGGMTIVPDFTFSQAPPPQVLVVPTSRGSEASVDYIRRVSAGNHITMSVCTGAFLLGRAGLLDGLTATTHHEFQDEFAHDFPGVRLVRNTRFVEHERVATSAGLTAGVDLALRVVERYYGREIAQSTAHFMAHEGEAWKVALRRSSRVQIVA